MTFLLCSGRRKFIDLIQIPIVSSNIAALETSIDGSIFFTCTTCIVYQYFKELVAFVLKAGAKVRALFLTTKLFRKFFFSFSFYAGFSGSLCERERRYERITLANFLCESDCKDKNFIYYNPNFFGSFLFFSLSGIPLFHEVNFSRLSSLGKRVQKYALLVYTPNISNYFF